MREMILRMIKRTAKREGFLNPAVIGTIAFIESSFDPKAYNKDGNAFGVMQITPIALNDVNAFYKTNFQMTEMFDAEKNILVGIRLIKLNLMRIGHALGVGWKEVLRRPDGIMLLIISYHEGIGRALAFIRGELGYKQLSRRTLEYFGKFAEHYKEVEKWMQ